MFTIKSEQSFPRPWAFWTLFFFLQINNVLCELQPSKSLWGKRDSTVNQRSPHNREQLLKLCILKCHSPLSASCFIRILGFERSSEVLPSKLTRGRLFPFDQFPDAKFQDIRAVLFSSLFLRLVFAPFTAVEAEGAGEQQIFRGGPQSSEPWGKETSVAGP